MHWLTRRFLILLLLVPAVAQTARPPATLQKSASAPVSFFRDVWPILQVKCQGCHSAVAKPGGLILTSYQDLQAGGEKGKVIVPGAPEKSLLISYLAGETKPQMPFGGEPLAAEQIELFRRWIAQGATDDTPAGALEVAAVTHPDVYRAAPVTTALAYSPDGMLLAISGYREILLHRADGSGLIARLQSKSDRIQSLAFSPDGTLLAAAGGTPATFGELQVWEVAQRKLKFSIETSNDTLFGVSFSPDGSKLAFGGADNSIRVIDVAAGQELRKMNHHDGWVFATAFSVDGTQLVSVSRDRAVKLTDVSSGAFIENINPLKEELLCLARHPRKDVVVVGGQDGVPVMYLMHRPHALVIGDTSTVVREFENQDGAVIAVAFSPDGQRIAVGGAAGKVHLYNIENGKLVADFSVAEGGVYTVAFRPGGEQLAVGGFDGKIRIFDLKIFKLAKEFVPVPLEAGTQAAGGGR